MARSTETHRIGNIENLESKKLMTADIGLDMADAADATVQVGHEFVADSFSFGVEREMKESGEKGGTEDINIGVGELQECTISKSMDRASVLLEEAASGDGKDYDGGDWFIADSFSFGVEREMKESGEKGGTADMNIGVGELQECTVSKSMDAASGKLAQAVINGNSCGTAEIDFVEVGGGGSEGTAEIEFVEVAAGEAESTDSGQRNNVGELKENNVDAAMQTWSISGDADDRPTEEVAFYYNKV